MEDFDIIKISKIDGDFEGFDDQVLFKLMDGSCWVQDEYKYWYHYSYYPEAKIIMKGGRLYIQVDRLPEIVPVREINGIIESKINGEFKGWEGETTYELSNGQVWQQSKYKYQYKYAYMPRVLIYNPGGGYIMKVKGTTSKVRRIK